MKLRTFIAPDMPAAMQMVREALGDEAIIISSKSVVNGKKGISVTAAIDTDDDDDLPLPATQAAAEAAPGATLSDLRFALQNILRFHNMPEIFVAKLLQKANDQELSSIIGLHKIGTNRDPAHLYRMALEKMVSGFFTFNPLPLEKPGLRLMLVGMPGIGKTLTVAKMAARLAMDGMPLAVITTDNKRAGGIEQLRAFTSILGLELRLANDYEELKSITGALPREMRVLVDTAGCNPYAANEIKEVAQYASLPGIEPVLVMPAGGDSLEAVDMAESFAGLPLKRLLVTQADTARRFGSVLSVGAANGLSFCNISSSSSIVDTLQHATPTLLAQLLLRYQLQTPTS